MGLRSSTDRAAFINMEVTYGTAPTMAAANAFLLMDSEITPAADKLERNVDQPFYGGNPFVLVGKKITLTGTIDVLGAAAGGSTTPAPLGKVYRACGHSEATQAAVVGPPAVPVSYAYLPISKNFESVCIDFFWAGVKFRMLGVRGSMDFDFTIKQFPMAKVTLVGILTIPSDAEAYSGADYSAFQTPAAIESGVWSVVVGPLTGLTPVAVCAQSLTLAANADVNLFECSTNRQVLETDRKPTGTLKVYKDATLATWNPWAIADTQAVMLMDCTMTKAVGLNALLRIRAQLEYPKPTDIDGVAGFEIPYTCIPSGAGGDEYQLYVY